MVPLILHKEGARPLRLVTRIIHEEFEIISELNGPLEQFIRLKLGHQNPTLGSKPRELLEGPHPSTFICMFKQTVINL